VTEAGVVHELLASPMLAALVGGAQQRGPNQQDWRQLAADALLLIDCLGEAAGALSTRPHVDVLVRKVCIASLQP
jgi:hypothetical protein